MGGGDEGKVGFHNNSSIFTMKPKYSPWKCIYSNSLNKYFKGNGGITLLLKFKVTAAKHISSYENEQFHEPSEEHMVTTNLVT